MYHERGKHIDTRYHFIRECVSDGIAEVEHVGTDKATCRHHDKAFGQSQIRGDASRAGSQSGESRLRGDCWSILM